MACERLTLILTLAPSRDWTPVTAAKVPCSHPWTTREFPIIYVYRGARLESRKVKCFRRMGKGSSRKGHEKRAQWLPLISDFPLRVSLWYWAYPEATIVISCPAGMRKWVLLLCLNTLQNESQSLDLRMRLERSSSSSVWCLVKEGAAGFGIRWHPCCLKLHWSPWGHPCSHGVGRQGGAYV